MQDARSFLPEALSNEDFMSQTVRVMHFADTHFGVELYGKQDPETGLNTRLLDFRQSLSKAIELALEEGIDLAVFAGDAYKTRDPRQTDQREFAFCIRELTDRGIPVVMLVGNHDMPVMRGRANAIEIYRTLGVTNVTIISRPEIHISQTNAGPVRIAGMPYLMKGVMMAREAFQGLSLDESRLKVEEQYSIYLQDLADQIKEADDDIPTILMGHFWASGAKLSSRDQGAIDRHEAQVAISSLNIPAFDYVALGHIHKHQDLNKNSQPHIVYCGSPDRIDFGEKGEPKGFCLVDLKKGETEFRFVEVTTGRPMIEIQVDADCDDPTEKIVAEIKKHNLRNAIVKLTYIVGQGRHAQVREREIKEALSGAWQLASFQRKINRVANERSREFTDEITPQQALELYIESKEDLLKQKDRLMTSANPLFEALLERGA